MPLFCIIFFISSFESFKFFFPEKILLITSILFGIIITLITTRSESSKMQNFAIFLIYVQILELTIPSTLIFHYKITGIAFPMGMLLLSVFFLIELKKHALINVFIFVFVVILSYFFKPFDIFKMVFARSLLIIPFFSFLLYLSDYYQIVSIIEKSTKEKKDSQLLNIKQTISSSFEFAGIQFFYYFPEENRCIQDKSALFEDYPNVIENYPDSWYQEGYVHPDYINIHRNMINKIKEGAKEAYCEVLTRFNGQYRWERLKFTSIYDREGNRTKVACFAQAFDDFKQLEKRFTLLTKQANLKIFSYDIKKDTITQYKDNVAFEDLPISFNDSWNQLVKSNSFFEEDQILIKKLFERAKTGLGANSVEVKLKKPDGSYRWMKFSLIPFRDATGFAIIALGLLSDIHETHLAREQFNESVERTLESEENLIEIVTINLTTDKLITFKSVNQVEEFERTPENIYKQYNQAINKFSRENPKLELLSTKKLKDSYYKNITFISEKYIKNAKDGSFFYAKTDIKIIQNPLTKELFAFLITYNLEDEFRRETSFNQSISQAFNLIGFINTNTEYIYYYLTEDKEDFIPIIQERKYLVEEFFKFYEPRIIEQERNKVLYDLSLKNIVEKLNDKKFFEYKFKFLNYENKEEIDLFRFTYYDKELGIITFYSVDITDTIKEEKEQTKQLSLALEKAEKADSAKSNFLSRMSHEIRTPLNAIIGMAELTLDSKNKQDAMFYSTKIIESGKFLMSLLNDILDMSKIEQGEIKLIEETFNFRTFIELVDSIIRPLTKAKKQNYILDYPQKDIYLQFDKIRYQQVLINILNNAIKYTPIEGTIKFSSEIIELKDHKVIAKNIISDTGVGISKSFINEMFKPFTREHNSLSSTEGGTGLGLAICKNIIDLMGGKIEVESEINKGTTFIISIPLDEKEKIDIKPVVNNTNIKDFEKSSQKHILVVEDHPLNSLIIKRLLENKDFKVTTCSNGKEAIQEFKLQGLNYYSLILMDIRMPVLDGYAATEEIRKIDKTTPIIALSANAYPEDINKSLQVGMNAHISKPINKKELFDTIKEFI